MACLQMAVFRRTGRLFDQEWLGARFGVSVPSSEASTFRYALNFLLPDSFLREGISTVDSTQAMNRFFDEFDLPLEARAIRPCDSEFDRLEERVFEWINGGADVWTEFVVGEKGSANAYSHDCLVEKIDLRSKSVSLLDPDPRGENHKKISVEEWKNRMSGEYGRPTGIVLLFPK